MLLVLLLRLWLWLWLELDSEAGEGARGWAALVTEQHSSAVTRKSESRGGEGVVGTRLAWLLVDWTTSSRPKIGPLSRSTLLGLLRLRMFAVLCFSSPGHCGESNWATLFRFWSVSCGLGGLCGFWGGGQGDERRE